MGLTKGLENSIVLQIDEAKRTLTNNGSTAPIILGVKGDDCAERVYFEAPAQLSPEINLLETADTAGNEVKMHVYVNFMNAGRETYIQECLNLSKDVTSDQAIFSWVVSSNATEYKGEVKFNVCIKREWKDPEDGVWKYTNEWHTTTFVGKILEGVDVSKKTHEVITHDSTSIQALVQQVNDYEEAVGGYASELITLQGIITTTDEFIATEVNKIAPGIIDEKMEAGYVTKKTFNEFQTSTGTKFDSYLPLDGGTLNGNIKWSGGGIEYASVAAGFETEYAGFGFSWDGKPTIVSKDYTLYFNETLDFNDYTYEYAFPKKSGTVALTSDIPEVPKYYEHRISFINNTIRNICKVYFTLVSKSDDPITSWDFLQGVLFTNENATDSTKAVAASGYVNLTTESDSEAYGIVYGVYATSRTDIVICYFRTNNGQSYEYNTFALPKSDISIVDTIKEIN